MERKSHWGSVLSAVAVTGLVLSITTLISKELDNEQDQFYSIYESTPSISIDLGEDIDYMCLSSSEYGQPYLPEGFQCYDCERTDETQEIIDQGYTHNHILLIVRSENQIRAMKVDLSILNSEELVTSYRGAAFGPEAIINHRQCIENPSGLASCQPRYARCRFLFEISNYEEGP